MDCPGINITTRSDWGAPALNASIPYLLHPVRSMVYTDTKGEACTEFDMCRAVVTAIRDFHTDTTTWTAQTSANFVPEIFYNFLIGMDGSVFEGRGWDRRADYHRDYNDQSIVTAFIENIPTTGDGYRALTYAAAKAANNLLKCAQRKGYLNPGNDSVIVNIHQQAKSYILYPETMQCNPITWHFMYCITTETE
ncbi:peptidoglycan recognition protein 1-like [Paramacrobiotus metropolitanus]|uniref:peptidoglycan recognition protein 1-like n=1 Tax=Paramacrobiotus metropolitanus TaxID=2943436 RepID=UPI0024461149|nr:peptidoglycan recognition protein 1-like [Paramacrobiotus metropolitanus]